MFLYYVIVFLPLLGFLAAGFGGHFLGSTGAAFLTSAFMVISAICSWIVFFIIAFGQMDILQIPILHWVSVGTLHFDWAFRIDTLTVIMLVVVNSVSALVHIYSIGYMHHDNSQPRFFAYLSLFTFMMLMLVTSDNFLQMFFGWEGVGLASYLLIGFWYQRDRANKAAMKAFIVNRVGDFGFLLGIFSCFIVFGSVEFDVIFAKARSGDFAQSMNFLDWTLSQEGAVTAICLFLFIGAMGKSAQLLLHVWLPDAMEGPTPVSALIHAATMVTAGVFMIVRMSPVFELSPMALSIMVFVGATTAFFAATVALVQNDIKRVIAYSTCSQLGYMFAALGVGAYGAAMFHLFTHAFFKALLFLGAGSVIHAVSDEQDMRRMGGLRSLLPMTYWMMIIGTIALTGVGIPGTILGTSGFFSKDLIIESVYASSRTMSNYAFYLLIITAFLTSFYSWRLIFMTFHGKLKTPSDKIDHIAEPPFSMWIPMVILAMGAIFSGILFEPYFAGSHYQSFWKEALLLAPSNDILSLAHHVPLWVKFLPIVVMTAGAILAWLCYSLRPALPGYFARFSSLLYRLVLNKWYFDELYNFLFVRPVFVWGNFLWKIIDIRIIDGFGPNGLAARVLDVTHKFVLMQTGYLYHYAFAMVIGIAIFLTLMIAGG